VYFNLFFQIYANNPARMAAALWKPKTDLSFIQSIKWGVDHEDEARQQYEQDTGRKVNQCGLLVSRKIPIFAVSPDGLIQCSKGMLEIKCPWSLKDCDVNNMTTVASSQFFTCDDKGKLSLKRTHGYFFQIQLGMYVTGCEFTDFVI
jgi:hypothetical protein